MSKKLLPLLVVLTMQLFLANVIAQNGTHNAFESENNLYKLSYESQLKPIAINQIHSWTLQLNDAEGEPVSDAEFTISGGMPEHNHGLATAPSINLIGEGKYLLQGLRFHMLGYWELELTITHQGNTNKVVISLDL